MGNNELFLGRILKKEDRLRYIAGLFKVKVGTLVLTEKELYFLYRDKKVFSIPLNDIISVNSEKNSTAGAGNLVVIFREGNKEKSVKIYQTSLSFTLSFGNLTRTAQSYFTAWELAINQARQGPWYRGGDGIEDIKKLARLRDQGMITEEEFIAKKRQILNI